METLESLTRFCTKALKFIDFADSLKELSTCKRQQCSCVIFPLDCSSVYAIGYNGPGRKLPNDYCNEQPKQCGCAHAEANALVQCDVSTCRPSLLYTTTAPCPYCAPLIINAGIFKGVIWGQPYTTDAGLIQLQEAGISTPNVDLVREFVVFNKEPAEVLWHFLRCKEIAEHKWRF